MKWSNAPLSASPASQSICWTAASTRVALAIEDLPVVRRQHAQLVILQIDDRSALPTRAAGIAGQEVLALADADHQRAAQAGADDQVGMLRTDDGQAVGPLEQAEARLRRRPSTRSSLVDDAVGDQLGDDLGVGVAAEDDAFGLQLAFERRRSSR